MVTASQALKLLPPYRGDRLLIQERQEVKDIIHEILQAHQVFKNDYLKLAKYFDAGDLVKTAKNIFKFCKDNIRYEIETENQQTTKSASAILAHGYGDCKHYASMIGGILSAIERLRGEKINWWFRFSSYNFFDETPQHVFVVLETAGREYWIDPVLPNFNNRKEYFYKIDKLPIMPLHRVSGIGNMYDPAEYYEDSVGNIFKKAGAAIKKVAKGVAKGAKATFKVVKKIAASPPRNAFLALVGLNIHGFATALKSADQAKVKTMWEKLGGNYDKLKNTFMKGATKKRIMGIPEEITFQNSVGEPVTAATILAAAAPIIAAMAALLKSAKGAASETAASVENAIETVKEAVTNSGEYVPTRELTPASVTQELLTPQQYNQMQESGQGQEQGQEAPAPGNNNLLLLAGAGAAAYFIFSKRR